MTQRPRTGFTVIELIVIITVIATLATIAFIGYGSWQRSIAEKSIRSDIKQAASGLEAYSNFKNSYPPNLAGINFAASEDIALTLKTNAPTVGVFENLTPEENSQLFINSCNGKIFDTPNNTACKSQGNGGGAKVHVKGTVASNTIWNSPINESSVKLPCGSVCDAITDDIIAQFKAQGGTFPVIVNGSASPLPEPTLKISGKANRFCLEARSTTYDDFSLHIVNGSASKVKLGSCPDDPDLHYFK